MRVSRPGFARAPLLAVALAACAGGDAPLPFVPVESPPFHRFDRVTPVTHEVVGFTAAGDTVFATLRDGLLAREAGGWRPVNIPQPRPASIDDPLALDASGTPWLGTMGMVRTGARPDAMNVILTLPRADREVRVRTGGSATWVLSLGSVHPGDERYAVAWQRAPGGWTDLELPGAVAGERFDPWDAVGEASGALVVAGNRVALPATITPVLLRWRPGGWETLDLSAVLVDGDESVTALAHGGPGSGGRTCGLLGGGFVRGQAGTRILCVAGTTLTVVAPPASIGLPVALSVDPSGRVAVLGEHGMGLRDGDGWRTLDFPPGWVAGRAIVALADGVLVASVVDSRQAGVRAIVEGRP